MLSPETLLTKVILGLIVMFILGFCTHWIAGIVITEWKRKKYEESESDFHLPTFLFSSNLQQLNLLNERAIAEDRHGFWLKIWKELHIKENTFMSFYIIIPTYFAKSKLALEYEWFLHVVDHSYEEGWYDMQFSHRRESPIKMRIHYFDIPKFNTACSAGVGMDMTILNHTLSRLTAAIKENK